MKRTHLLCAAILVVASVRAGGAEVTGSFFAVIVDDIEASERWYRDTLGLTAGERLREAGRYEIVNLQRPGLFVELLQLAGTADRPDGFVKGPFKPGLLVGDLRSFLAALPAGADRPEIIEDEANGLLLIQLRDPDGNVVQVMQTAD